MGGRREREWPNKQWDLAMITGPENPPTEEEVSSPPRVFPVLAALANAIATLATEVPWGWSLRRWRKKRERTQRVSPPLYLSFRSLFFASWARSRGLFLKLCLYTTVLTSRFQVMLSSGWGMLKLKNSKLKQKQLITGSMVLWIQVFFLNTLAYIFFAEQVSKYSAWVL